jgi:hypothetical protein
MNNILMRIDRLLCDFLGLDKIELVPHLVTKKGKELVVMNTESFKRHIQETSISELNLAMIDNENKKKLGIAVGKVIAKNLIVSFDEINIKRENIHA